MFPGFEYLNNGQKHIIVRFAASFGWNHFLWVVSYRVSLDQII